ncbi:hypothetical protein ACIBG7_25950 [Nonomuraea sp. NPDC050328]|uniref:hypothetical protein n=1 Tax=Nonomuraea sp. NPDC050328 TaxID=3364361 RepID=UPI0037B10B28
MRTNLVLGATVALLLGAALPAPASAAAGVHWGPVQSAGGHGGYAKADVWISDFSAETFQVYGKLYDRDPHRDHCATVRARFHYAGGGTGWSRAKSTCSPSGSFRLSSDGEIKRVDVRVCVYDTARRATLKCHHDAITPEIIAGWPQ